MGERKKREDRTIFLFSLSFKTDGLSTRHITQTVIREADRWVSRLLIGGYEILPTLPCGYLPLCEILAFVAFFKGHHKWVFASEVLINKKCCLTCFLVDDLRGG